MNTSFEKSKNSTDEWYTPKEIIDALGEFDLDPCAPMRPLWRTARVMYNKEQDGLKQKWEGRVWLNPPYSRPTIEHFITRMVEHNNGIALLFNRQLRNLLEDGEYIPSLGQLNLMAHYMDELNKAFTYVSASPLSSTWYWSSTESSQAVAWYVVFSSGLTGTGNKHIGDMVRTVIDF